MLRTIHQTIIETSKSTNPVFEDLTFSNLESGNKTVKSLSNHKEIERIRSKINFNSLTKTIRIRVAPAIIHDMRQDWIKRELDAMRPTFLNQSEYDSLLVRVGATFRGFTEPYQMSSKEPDLCIILNHPEPFQPTVVVETG